MKKKSYIGMFGLMILLIFFGIWFLSMNQTAPTEEVEPEPVVEIEPKPTEEVEPEPVMEVGSEPAPTIEVKPAGFDIVPLEDQDCIKCHPSAVKDVNKRGGLHQPLGCSECHLEHPPLGNESDSNM